MKRIIRTVVTTESDMNSVITFLTRARLPVWIQDATAPKPAQPEAPRAESKTKSESNDNHETPRRPERGRYLAMKRKLALKLLRLLTQRPEGSLVRHLVDPCDAELRELGRPDRSQFLSSILWLWVSKGCVEKRPSDVGTVGERVPNLYFITDLGREELAGGRARR